MVKPPAPLTYIEVYRNLDGLTALATAATTPLRRLKDEKDTAFVKRIVATYLQLASDASTIGRCAAQRRSMTHAL